MSKINTVLGPVDAETLGLTLAHEHITTGYPGWECDPLARPYNREKIVEVCFKNIEPVKDYGVNTIIDATPLDLARDVDVMRDVAEKLQMNIVCATGRYTEDEGKWMYLKHRQKNKIGDMRTEIYDGFMKELTSGIGQTDIKPGIIKVSTGLGGISSCEEAVLLAAARAAKETGIPIMTHTHEGTMGPEQAEMLIGEGVAPKNIAIGHMCGNPSMQYQLDVLKKEVYIAFDRFGIELSVSDEVRTKTLISLLEMGYANRILLSHDFIACMYGRGGQMPAEAAQKAGLNWNLTHIFKNIIPALKKAGITDDQIKTMTVDNPKRFLSGL